MQSWLSVSKPQFVKLACWLLCRPRQSSLCAKIAAAHRTTRFRIKRASWSEAQVLSEVEGSLSYVNLYLMYPDNIICASFKIKHTQKVPIFTQKVPIFTQKVPKKYSFLLRKHAFLLIFALPILTLAHLIEIFAPESWFLAQKLRSTPKKNLSKPPFFKNSRHFQFFFLG